MTEPLAMGLDGGEPQGARGEESEPPAVPATHAEDGDVASAEGREETPATEPPSIPSAVPASVLALPLRARLLFPVSLDLLVRAETRLRAPSFYIGFLLAATVGPTIALLAAATLAFGDIAFEAGQIDAAAWGGWLLLGACVAIPAYVVISVEARVLATAVIAGTVEGRPLTMPGLLGLARRRFWTAARASVLVAIPELIGQRVASVAAESVGDPSGEIAFTAQVVGSLVFGVPFVYVVAGIVIGEVGAVEAVRRSWRLFRARPRLAVAVAAFSVVSQFILLFALSAGADVAFRIFGAVGIGAGTPVVIVVALTLVLVFAFGTLVLLAEAIAATPQVHAFIALTHYTRGLEAGRRPEDVARGARAWITRPLVIGIVVAAGALVAGLLALPA